MREARSPRALMGPPPLVPVRAIGFNVLDAQARTIATCPSIDLADFVAWSINVLNGVHQP